VPCRTDPERAGTPRQLRRAGNLSEDSLEVTWLPPASLVRSASPAPASVDCQSRSPRRQANRTALVPTEYTVMYKRRTEPGEPPVRWLELVVDASKGTQATLSLLRPVPSLPPARPAASGSVLLLESAD
jgi:hypothetical protein